jgi:DNA-binding MarR family transcriptional regulator
LITREVGVEDRRTFVINTTTKGRKLAEQIRDHLTALEDAVSRRVTKSDVRGFLKVLSAVEEIAREATAERSRR